MDFEAMEQRLRQEIRKAAIGISDSVQVVKEHVRLTEDRYKDLDANLDKLARPLVKSRWTLAVVVVLSVGLFFLGRWSV